jgi:hypothetical protein
VWVHKNSDEIINYIEKYGISEFDLDILLTTDFSAHKVIVKYFYNKGFKFNEQQKYMIKMFLGEEYYKMLNIEDLLEII